MPDIARGAPTFVAPSKLDSAKPLPAFYLDNWSRTAIAFGTTAPRKEVIQPQVPLRLPCYDFTPVTNHSVDTCLPEVGSVASGAAGFRDVTGGVYKARERIHRGMLIRDY